MRVNAPSPSCEPAIPEGTADSVMRRIECTVSALTPIFKGGSHSSKPDEGKPFRPSAIRGMLRFWWRASAPYTDVDQIRDAEKRIFGGVFKDRAGEKQTRVQAVASQVRLSVHDQRSELAPRPRGLEYSYAMGVCGNEPPHHECHGAGASARLLVTWPRELDGTDGERLANALRAWILFGGIGGRTRRGMGAVWSGDLDILPAITSPERLVETWGELAGAARGGARPWPTLAGSQLLVQPTQHMSADSALRAALETMKKARISKSVWDRHTEWHTTMPRPMTDWAGQDYDNFVVGRTFHSRRAALGLPIQFRSQRSGRWELNFRDYNRMPSPVLLRPVPVAGESGRGFHAVMLCLRTPRHEEPLQTGRGGNTVRGSIDHSGLDHFLELVVKQGWQRYKS